MIKITITIMELKISEKEKTQLVTLKDNKQAWQASQVEHHLHQPITSTCVPSIFNNN